MGNDFRNEWAVLASSTVPDDSFSLYEVDTARWIGGCPYFIHSRSLLCKHLVHRCLVMGNSMGHLTPRRYVIMRNPFPPYVRLVPSTLPDLARSPPVDFSAIPSPPTLPSPTTSPAAADSAKPIDVVATLTKAVRRSWMPRLLDVMGMLSQPANCLQR
ncbi:hypothetical protein DM01DRAFT_1397755 [Hesseltinella vesiculosa]|uniref:SWIM-type domain-containing protein n=1 Tax=Hesseltinella vesiculosa TaxID=101127 RepID=A0A1X2GT34_9FUNG|nr:hypothetical protein DM01DRAFT_1397755 [Hesseltinella vesiculosa]